MGKIHAHPRVVSLLQHGYRLDFKILPKLSKIPLILSEYHNKYKDGALHEAVQAMLSKKAITHVRKPTTLGYYSRLFLVPKPDRYKYVEHPFTCSNFQNGNSQIYQEVDSKRGVGHLDRPHRRLFSCSNTSTISKISEISDQKRGFPISGSPFWCRHSSPRVYLHCERGKTQLKPGTSESINIWTTGFFGHQQRNNVSKIQKI